MFSSKYALLYIQLILKIKILICISAKYTLFINYFKIQLCYILNLVFRDTQFKVIIKIKVIKNKNLYISNLRLTK